MNLRLDDYFSDENIIESLIKIRASKAKERHDLQFFKNLNSKARNPDSVRHGVDNFFPPRKSWYRPTLKERKYKTSYEINILALKKTIFHKIKTNAAFDESWYKELFEFINKIKISALQKIDYEISEPSILPIEKDPDKKIYRPLAIYDLKDRIIIGLTAKYLRDVVDSVFLKCSYAFRAKRDYPEKIPTHHTSVEDILNYLDKHYGKKLYVAECDIKKFYDSVHHGKALNALYEVAHRINEDGKYIDSRAIKIFESFLKSYTFLKTAKVKGEEWFNKNGIDGEIKWIKEDLEKIYDCVSDEPIGVSQGGALSPIIANLILDKADREVFRNEDTDLFYARYCDDMIIIHPDKHKCKETFERYIEALKETNLVIHEPVSIKKYDKEFYQYKSKETYMWGKPDGNNVIVPWISFVGYQIRYDKKIRIRKKSVKKELLKQVKLADNVIKMIELENRTSNKTKRQILFRLTNKLISMSVGRVKLNDKLEMNPQMCWVNGFKVLKSYDSDLSQLKSLDRNRERQICRVKRRLEAHNIKSENPNKKIKPPKYYGAPFSYYSQFRGGE